MTAPLVQLRDVTKHFDQSRSIGARLTGAPPVRVLDPHDLEAERGRYERRSMLAPPA